MNPVTVIQVLSAILGIVSQATPLIEQTIAAIQSGDQASLDALLAKLQASNDALAKE